MYQASTAGTGCLGCGLGQSFVAVDSEREGIRPLEAGSLQARTHLHPGVFAIMQAVERGDIVLPDPGSTEAYTLDEPGAPGMPLWVYGVAGIGLLTLVGGGIWWFIKRGGGEELE